MLRLLAVLMIAASGVTVAPLGPLPASAQVADEARSIVVRGNRRIEVETILAYMDLQPGETVTASDLNLAVRRLFDTGLFRDVAIVPEQGQLVVQVIENPSINVIAFEGNDALSDEALQEIISLRPRLPFTPSRAEADAQAIIEIYRRTGRFGAEVEPVVIERPENRVDLVFEISEGELTGVSSIDFVGNEAFSDRRLRGEIETSETGLLSFLISSDVYDPDRLELDRELLRQFYLSRGHADFAVLSATAELAPDRSGFFLTFTVEEGPVYNFGELDVIVNARGLDPEEFAAVLPDDLLGETYDASAVEEIANELTDLAGQRGFAFVQVRPQPRKDTENLVIDVTFE
ncbi:MAG: outer membrane protein assembly factor BamA, partial [Pseudomonadota bacterium]